MRARRKLNRTSVPVGNLDSFLDIMTNTVGVLMFVSLFITLVAVQSGTTIRTPLVSQTRKNAHLFEIAENQVSYLDIDAIGQQIKEFVENLPTCEKPNEPDFYSVDDITLYIETTERYKICLAEQAERIDRFRPRTDSYEARLINIESFSWEYKRLDGKVGTSNERLQQANSPFREILNRLDPEKDYIAFIVRPDSFPTYRQAREIAWKQGFNVGWEPQNTDTSIILGTSGRSIGVQ